MNIRNRTGVALVLAAVMALLGMPAHANEPPQQVIVSDVHSPVLDVGEMPTADELPAGSTIEEFGTGSYVVSVPDRESDPRTRLSVGVGTTIYLYLSRDDQTILMSAGGGALVAAACISLGAVGCVGVSAAVGGAVAWVSINGFCPKRLEIAVARGYKCVS
jgi:hypothetical protein